MPVFVLFSPVRIDSRENVDDKQKSTRFGRTRVINHNGFLRGCSTPKTYTEEVQEGRTRIHFGLVSATEICQSFPLRSIAMGLAYRASGVAGLTLNTF